MIIMMFIIATWSSFTPCNLACKQISGGGIARKVVPSMTFEISWRIKIAISSIPPFPSFALLPNITSRNSWKQAFIRCCCLINQTFNLKRIASTFQFPFKYKLEFHQKNKSHAPKKFHCTISTLIHCAAQIEYAPNKILIECAHFGQIAFWQKVPFFYISLTTLPLKCYNDK